MNAQRFFVIIALGGLAFALLATPEAEAADQKPNILILWGDDIGYWNVSTYNHGMMGYKTQNIDRFATAPEPSSTAARPTS